MPDSVGVGHRGPEGEMEFPREQIEIETRTGLRFRADARGRPDAPLVLLLHGFPQTRHAWRDQLPVLARAGLRAIAPDQRGYSPGARPLELEAYAQARLMADVLDLADALGAARFDLVGHDWGGQVAWQVAAAAPERVRRLVVLSRPHPAAFSESLRSDREQTARSGHHTRFLDAAMTDRLLDEDARRLRRMLEQQGVARADADAYLEVLGERAALDAALHWYRAAGLASAAPSSAAPSSAVPGSAEKDGSEPASGPASGLARPRVPPVCVPTLYLWGDADATVGRMAAERTARYVNAEYRFEVVKGAGHFLTDQEPDVVNRALVGWLAAGEGEQHA